MIDNFENEDFERTLKEHADRFYLTPSVRVWKSIYNDLHPGSKWPSLAVGLFMILTLFWIGNTHTNGPADENISPEKSISPSRGTDNNLAPVVPITQKINSTEINRDRADENDLTGTQVSENRDMLPGNEEKGSGLAPVVAMHGAEPAVTIHRTDTRKRVAEDLNSMTVSNGAPATVINTGVNTRISANKLSDQPKIPRAAPVALLNGKTNDRMTARNDGIPPIPMRFQFRKKLKWEYFFSPMISNVMFGGSNLNKTSSSVVYSPTSKHNMDIAKKLGFITGANVYYPLTKTLSFTSGAHLIYTGYDIYTEVVMPNTTSITFKDSKGKLFSKTYISYYANEKKDGNANITNYNWQFSVPVGLKWDIFSHDNFKISVVSTIEPFMVLGSKAYLLSGDASSYVTDPDLIRKFNFSGNIGSIVTFSSNSVNWKIGPNLRYQVLSTYNNIYPVKEHFVNYGIHVGVSKK